MKKKRLKGLWFTQAAVEVRLCGGNKQAEGLPHKRRHLQQLRELTGKLWRFTNVG